MADFSKMTLEDLRAEFVDLGDQLSVISEARRAVLGEITVRESAAAASASIATLSADQKINLFSVLKSDPDVSQAALANAIAEERVKP